MGTRTLLITGATAGIGAGPIEELEPEQLAAQFQTNVLGLVQVTRAFVPAMRARGSGRVLNVASILGHLTLPFLGAYCATQYAVEALSDALRGELSCLRRQGRAD